jgi:cytochrome P450
MSSSINLFDPAFREDPYPFYAESRARSPVAQVDPIGAWLVTGYDAVVEVLKSPSVYSSAAMHGAMSQIETDDSEDDGPPPMVITTDPPKHDRLRTLVNRGFTPGRIGRIEPRIREIAADLFASMDARGECDLVADLAVPVPVRVIAELLGVDPDRFEDFKRWSQAAIAIFGRQASPEVRSAANAAIDELSDYIEAAAEERRVDPRQDLISVLIEKEAEDALTVDEVTGFVILMLIAGNETTTNLIGSTAIALLDNPDQLAVVQAEPARIPDLVEEALRHTSPVQLLFRQTLREVQLGGVTLPAGAIVLPSYAAANRDPARFPDPDRFDVKRNTQGHLSFGLGIHFCLGAGLARLEARAVFEGLVPRLEKLQRRDSKIRWSESPFLRGPLELRVGPR